MKTISQAALTQLSNDAQLSPRKRQHLNVHTELTDPIQRLFVAFEPGTYVQPHRHPEAGKWEMFVLITGSAAVLFFDQAGRVQQRIALDAQAGQRLIEIPPQQWHTLVSLAPGTLLYETKPGPYIPLSDKDFAGWAPRENSPAVTAFVRWLEHAQVDETAPILKA